MIDPAKLQSGIRVYFTAGKDYCARVDDVTTNYVSLHWERTERTHHNDIILKTSPLWRLLELVP